MAEEAAATPVEGEAGVFGLLDAVLILVVVLIVVFLVQRFRRKRSDESNKLRDLKINTV